MLQNKKNIPIKLFVSMLLRRNLFLFLEVGLAEPSLEPPISESISVAAGCFNLFCSIVNPDD